MIAFAVHWQELLHQYLLRRQNETFNWGTMDCCLFACDAVRELTGVDLAVDFRGKYDSLLTAIKVMKKFTAQVAKDVEVGEVEHRSFNRSEIAEIFSIPPEQIMDCESSPTADSDLVETVAIVIAAANAIEEVPLLMAQRGDVILLDSPLGKGLGILGLRGTHVHCAGPDGIVDVPLQECYRAWRIPKFAPVPPEATIV